MLKRILAIAALSLLSFVSYAGDAVLTWTAPTQNVDGTAIPATGPGSLAGFRIYYRPSTSSTDTLIVVSDPLATTYTITGLVSGTWNFQMTAYNAENVESDKSNAVSKTILEAPLPPSMQLVTVDTSVYNVVKKTNGFALIRMGSVPLNTPCDPMQSVNGHNAVPTSAVTWSGTARSIVVVAKCSSY